jgi:hypothetical protein
MTDREAEYGERLRRALHSAADGIAPSGDGLDRIRQRITHRPGQDSLHWLIGWASPTGATRLWVSDAKLWLGDTWLRLSAGVLRPAWRWLSDQWLTMLRPGGPLDGWRERVKGWLGDGWLRPVLATAGAILIATVAVLAIPGLRQDIIEAGSIGPSSNPAAPGSPGGVIPGPITQPPQHSAPVPARKSPGPGSKPAGHHHGTAPPTSCPTATGAGATAAPVVTGSPSPADTTVLCPTPSATPSPTPSPSDTSTGTPSGSPTP